MKVKVTRDEVYPVYNFSPDNKIMDGTIELTPEQIDFCTFAIAEHEKAQAILHAAWKKTEVGMYRCR